MFPIFVKDFRSALRSPVAWSGFAGTTAVCAALFAAGLKANVAANDTFGAFLCSRLLFALCVPCALFTMGLFAGERSRGTLDTLLAAPVSERALILSKFWAAFILVCVSIAFASASALIYLRLAAPPPEFSRAEIVGALAICALAAAVWTAAGTFFSALSYHQAPACVATLALALGSASLLTRTFPGFTGAMFPDLADFARGVADTRVVFAALTLDNVAIGLVKAVTFGLLVGLVGCSHGLRTNRTADAVGQAATAAVVGSLVLITVFDGIFAVLFYVLKM